MIKNIVFDFGGVIVDIDRDKAVQALSNWDWRMPILVWTNTIRPESSKNWKKES